MNGADYIWIYNQMPDNGEIVSADLRRRSSIEYAGIASSSGTGDRNVKCASIRIWDEEKEECSRSEHKYFPTIEEGVDWINQALDLSPLPGKKVTSENCFVVENRARPFSEVVNEVVNSRPILDRVLL